MTKRQREVDALDSATDTSERRAMLTASTDGASFGSPSLMASALGLPRELEPALVRRIEAQVEKNVSERSKPIATAHGKAKAALPAVWPIKYMHASPAATGSRKQYKPIATAHGKAKAALPAVWPIKYMCTLPTAASASRTIKRKKVSEGAAMDELAALFPPKKARKAEVKTPTCSAIQDTPLPVEDAAASLGLQVTHTIGEGGSSTVYLASHSASGHQFAVKKITEPVGLPEAVRPFFQVCVQRELDIHRALIHKRIVRLFASLENAGSPLLVMEYLPLGSVYDLLCQGPLPEAKAARCICDVACGIAHMHALGYAHRDIKADNILVETNGRYKVADFGLSVYTVDQQQHGSAGTADYMSPEVAAGLPHDATTDLWSLGILAYELLVGRTPFFDDMKDTPDEIKKRVQVGHVPRPPHVSDSAWDLIEKLLQHNKVERLPADRVLEHVWIKTHCGDNY